MPYTPKQRTRRQRQRRKAGHVKRFEIVLSADNERDHDLHDFLTQLPRGEVSEFIKVAIVEKIQRRNSPTSETPEPAEQLNAILAELAALKKAVTIPPSIELMAAAPMATREELTASSGLDMSRPRPKRPTPAAPIPPPTLPEEKPFDEAAARRMLVESINRFGKNRAGD